MGSLTTLLSLRARGTGPSVMAREIALELGDGSFAPDLVEHLPGVENVEADELSRRYDPLHQPWSLPAVFRGVPETVLPARPRSWYLTLGPPPRHPASQAGSSGGSREEKAERDREILFQ